MCAKYAPLVRYLAAQPGDRVTLTLAEIEAIIGTLLPPAARRRYWWQTTQAPTSLRPLVQAAGWRIVLDGFWGRTPAVTFVRTGQQTYPQDRRRLPA